MGCGCGNKENKITRPGRIQAAFWTYAAKGMAKEAAKVRATMACFCGSPCGLLCSQLIKGPGVSQVSCLHPETGELTPLYPALEEIAFQCPKGLF